MITTQNMKKGILLSVIAAVLYALNAPLSKLMLDYLSPTLMAGFLYIGAGIGMVIIAMIRKCRRRENIESHLTKAELPYTIAMVVLDIAAPICLLLGLKSTTAAHASLLNNFEIVATAVIALIIFKEKISRRLWIGIVFIILACMLLSIEDMTSFQFSYGSCLILLACICWGFENNCTKKISSKDPLEIVLIKGICSGLGSIIIGFCIGEKITVLWSVFATIIVGFIAYGLSIFFYVYAQRLVGAARTSAYYAIAPFIGAFLSLIIFRQLPNKVYFLALGLMGIGAWLSSQDKPLWRKKLPPKQRKE